MDIEGAIEGIEAELRRLGETADDDSTAFSLLTHQHRTATLGAALVHLLRYRASVEPYTPPSRAAVGTRPDCPWALRRRFT